MQLRAYMIAKGYSFEVITDIGSGINYNKKGLNQLMDMVVTSEVEKISCKLQGRKADKAKRMIRELLKDDNSPES